jgi:hypothetical protein
MKSKDLIKLFSMKDKILIQETLQDKGHSREIENNDLQNKLILLNQEIQKRYNELMIYYKTEKNKILIQHNQKMKMIDLQ